MIGLDTTAIIDIFRGDAGIQDFLRKNREPISSTMLNYLELYFGIDNGSKNSKKEGDYYDEFFESIITFELKKDSCKKASEIMSYLKNRGTPIEGFDCAIAAIFLTNGVKKILTRNIKHFEKINGIEVLSY